MGQRHDDLANLAGGLILSFMRNNQPEWAQIFSSNLNRVGDWDWPRPDYIIYDNDKSVSYAQEFKPPYQSKREYLTGLGQAISYLQKHNYTGLIIPRFADDNFNIGEFILDTLKSEEFAHLPISLVVYDEEKLLNGEVDAIELLKGIDTVRTSTPISRFLETKTFWAFWRDSSQYEVFDLLKLSDKYIEKEGDIYSNYIYNEFYDRLTTGLTKQWDGSPRVKIANPKSKASEKQNYKIPLFQLGLWDQAEGRITPKGYRLLLTGKIYKPNSELFMNYLAKEILLEGKHLELMYYFERYQDDNAGNIPSTSKEYLLAVENYLDSKGLIGNRKPTAVTSGAKATYIRDETKLWNKFGFLKKKNQTSYFFPGEGIKFNWESITKVLLFDEKSII